MKQLISAILTLAAATGMAIGADTAPALDYRCAEGLPVHGTLAPDASEIYTRLPDSLKGRIREDLWNLGQNSAGIYIRFRSDSRNIGLRWHSRNKFNMNHMTPTGIRGLDLYAMTPDSGWTFLNSGRPSLAKATTEQRVATGMEPGEREYMLYLSLYDGVDSLWIGVDSAATLAAPAVALPEPRKPIVMYGTSILQGGCANRPGNVHTSILSRALNREVINLGFSGNARLDPEIAALMAQADASVFVLDNLPNCTPDMVAEKTEPFIRILRASHPTTPILLVESPYSPLMRFQPEVEATLRDKNARLRAIYERLSPADPNLHYFEGTQIFGDNAELTVDNYHMTDAGFMRFAALLHPVLEELLNRQQNNTINR